MIDADTMRGIILDISGEVDVDDSKLEYTPEMLEWREKQEKHLAELREDCPEANLYCPTELPEPDDE